MSVMVMISLSKSANIIFTVILLMFANQGLHDNLREIYLNNVICKRSLRTGSATPKRLQSQILSKLDLQIHIPYMSIVHLPSSLRARTPWERSSVH